MGHRVKEMKVPEVGGRTIFSMPSALCSMPIKNHVLDR